MSLAEVARRMNMSGRYERKFSASDVQHIEQRALDKLAHSKLASALRDCWN